MSLLPVADALARLLADVSSVGTETLPLAEAAGRVLAAPISALRTQPSFDASAMDGYAVRSADVSEPGASLRVIGRSVAGRRFDGAVGPGETVRIFTGAPVPPGANAILLQEDAKTLDNEMIEATEMVAAGRHIRKSGLDFRVGDRLLDAGRRLDPAALSLAAAAGHARLDVAARPRVAIIATGDELVLPGAPVGPDQIVASNGYGVAAICREAGAVVDDLGIAADDRAALSAVIDEALTIADIVVTLGGASVGDHDLVADVLLSKGLRLDFWKIAMRPGKPLLAGRLGKVVMLGLPGNPVSSLVCAHLFLRPLVERMQGAAPTSRRLDATLASAMKANDHRQDYVRAIVEPRADGRLVATPLKIQDSSMLSALARANALIVRPPLAPAAEAGDSCIVEIPFRSLTTL